MTFEALLERIAVALEKQVTLIEAFTAKAQALTAEKSTPRAKKEKVDVNSPEYLAAQAEITKKLGEGALGPKEEKPVITSPAEIKVPEPPKPEKPPETPKAPEAPTKITVEAIRAALYNVQKVKGASIARDIVVKVGNAEMVTKILEDKYPLVIQACEEALK